MTVIMSNTYVCDETNNVKQAFTGLIGVFESREKGIEVWNSTLRKIGVPEDELDDFQPGEGIKNTVIMLDENGKFTDDMDKVMFFLELMIKDTEMNKILTVGD